MEGDFGSEIGKKMRSAVKAKLLELGTGNSTGYIDDELPDYVMIMVANKRSKQQMITDLDLFLGEQTELFVTWLHEVLQKLNEVTLKVPTHSLTTKRRKSLQKDEVPQKKDKKTNKKDKTKPVKKPEEKTAVPTNAKKPSTSTSITDVFAEDLLKKAQQTYDFATDAAEHIKKGKGKKPAEATSSHARTSSTKASAPKTSQPQTDEETHDFDVSAVADLSSTSPSNRDKDLAELAELQDKIYAAKKHLKELAEDHNDDVDDDDFLNLKDDGLNEELNDDHEPAAARDTAKPKSPIVFSRQQQHQQQQQPEPKTPSPARLATAREPSLSLSPTPSPPKVVTPEHHASRSKEAAPAIRHSRERERDRRSERGVEPPGGEAKRPVHERLGLRQQAKEPPKDTRRVRQEKELYVPAFRRKELDRKRDRTPDRDRDRDRQREPDRGRDNDKDRNRERERERERERDRDRERERERNRCRDERPRERDRANRVRSRTGERSSEGGGGGPTPSPPLKDSHCGQSRKELPAGDEVQRHRIGSRVIVAPVKPIEPSDDEDLALAVNSVVKIKPRPVVSPSKQACKNLLLRAVAEAQRSTTLPKAKPAKETAVVKTINRSTKLYTKSFRDRLKRGAIEVTTAGAGGELFKRSTQQLVVAVERDRAGRTAVKGNRRRQVSPMVRDDDVDDVVEEYATEVTSDRGGESDLEYAYDTEPIQQVDDEEEHYDRDSADNSHGDNEEVEEDHTDKAAVTKTQFVVTLNEDKTPSKYKKALNMRSRSGTPEASPPLPKLRPNGKPSPPPRSTHPSRSRLRDSQPRNKPQHDLKGLHVKTSLSPSVVMRLSERESSNSSPSGSSAASQRRRSDLIEIYRKPKDVKKIIIKNDTDDEEYSPRKPAETKKFANGASARSRTPPLPPAAMPKRHSHDERKRTAHSQRETRSRTTSRTRSRSPLPKSKRTPIRYDLDRKRADNSADRRSPSSRRRSRGADERSERDLSLERPSGDERKRISIRNAEAKKYDNIPSLNSVAIESGMKSVKPKERCKYHPNCTKQFCDFYHPSAPCKAFPNCKYADKCMYSHPKCKYDLACTNIDCNYSHSGPRNTSQLQPTAPPLSSHVVPVQNYKSISAATPSVASTMCKYYPNCTKVGCPFFHPKPCRFGKNCINKLECNFYHAELQSSNKFKWVASIV